MQEIYSISLQSNTCAFKMSLVIFLCHATWQLVVRIGPEKAEWNDAQKTRGKTVMHASAWAKTKETPPTCTNTQWREDKQCISHLLQESVSHWACFPVSLDALWFSTHEIERYSSPRLSSQKPAAHGRRLWPGKESLLTVGQILHQRCGWYKT